MKVRIETIVEMGITPKEIIPHTDNSLSPSIIEGEEGKHPTDPEAIELSPCTKTDERKRMRVMKKLLKLQKKYADNKKEPDFYISFMKDIEGEKS